MGERISPPLLIQPRRVFKVKVLLQWIHILSSLGSVSLSLAGRSMDHGMA